MYLRLLNIVQFSYSFLAIFLLSYLEQFTVTLIIEQYRNIEKSFNSHKNYPGPCTSCLMNILGDQ